MLVVPIYRLFFGHGKLDQFSGSETLTVGNIHRLATLEILTSLSSSIRCALEKTQYPTLNFIVVD